MDPLVATIVMRSIERLIIVAGACLAIWCGYRLFLAMPNRERGTGKLELPGGVSIHVSRVGPGVFFTLFGALILGLSLHYGTAFSNSTAPGTQSAYYSGIGPGAGPTPVPARSEADATDVASAMVTVERLNRAAASLDPALDPFTRGDIERAIRSAKIHILTSVWNEAEWGPLAEFRLWISRGEPTEVPAGISHGVAAYRSGLPS